MLLLSQTIIILTLIVITSDTLCTLCGRQKLTSIQLLMYTLAIPFVCKLKEKEMENINYQEIKATLYYL